MQTSFRNTLFVFIILLALFLGALGGSPISTAQAAPIAQNETLPAGLNAADWAQIRALLPAAALPAQQAYLKASNTEANDAFGFSVAISGDTVVVGAETEASGATGVNGNQADNSASASGAAYVFIRSGATWNQQAYLKASNTGTSDWFGTAVAIAGDTIVVGASNEASSATGVNGNQADNSAMYSGAAYVFTRSGTTWSQQAYLKASNTGTSDGFGHQVAISGDTVVVGAEAEDSSATGVNGNQADNSVTGSGAAYLFTRSGATWSQQAYLKASNTGASDFFGSSVAISGDTVVVGAYGEGSKATGVNGDQADNSAPGSGAAYVFVRSGTTWSQQAFLKASNNRPVDWFEFGSMVAISGDTIVIGAKNEASNATGVNGNQADRSAAGSGAAYVFTRSGTTWSQQAYLKASNTEAGDGFGEAVAIAGDTIVVGADGESSSATGVNGNQADNSAAQSGAAYVFTRSGATWSQQAYLKASNAEAGDKFGFRVAISGDTVVVGTYNEDSNATGVNGNQTDNSATDSGAVYVFYGTSTPNPTISGNTGIAGATLSYVDGTTKTVTADESGNYTITVPSGWSGVVTPSKAEYIFTPLNREYTNVAADQPDQDYAAQFPVIINQASTQPDPADLSPIIFSVSFSEPVTGFTSADVVVSGTAPGLKTVVVAGSGAAYTVSVSGMTASGTVIASIPTGAAQGLHGSSSLASTSVDNSITFNFPASRAIKRVSLAPDGTQGNSGSDEPSISADGRYVAFSSAANNLASGDTNGYRDIFMRDTVTNTTTRASVASDGMQGNGDSYNPSISADGRYVAFESYASNLVSGDTNGTNDVFLHNNVTHTTMRISVASDGTQGEGESYFPTISADGRYVAFVSIVYNLVNGDITSISAIFVRDTVTNTTTRVSVASDGTQENEWSYTPSISADGRYVAFMSEASNLVGGDTNGVMDIFVRDTVTNTTTRVSVASDGMQGNGESFVPFISVDGRYVVFMSAASNLVSGDTNGLSDIFVRDTVTNITTRISVAADVTPWTSYSYTPSISADGRYVAFYSVANNLVGGDTNGYGDIFLHDTVTNITTRVSVASDGTQAINGSYNPMISADGRYITFESDAGNLVSEDTNGAGDVFVHENNVVSTGISISGRITDDSNGVAGVIISAGAGYVALTDSSGNYILSIPVGWSGTVTPSKTGYVFTPASKSYVTVTQDQTNQDYTASSGAAIDVYIGTSASPVGSYQLKTSESARVNYAGVNNGPLKITSTNGTPIIAALRDAWQANGVWTSFAQLMGLPVSQVSDTYYFPAYNNISLDEQLRFGNVGTADTTITVTIGGLVKGSYFLHPGESARVNYAGVNGGPVIVKSSGGVNIIAAERDAWQWNGVWYSFVQLMGLPASQLSDTYYFPAYNNISLDEQLRFGNVGTADTTVTVTIGGQVKGSYFLHPNESARVNYAGVNSGPVVVQSSDGVPIIAAERDAWQANGVWTCFAQTMGLPVSQVSDTYVFPAYNNISLDEQLRFGNVGTADTTVTVTIGGQPMGSYFLHPSESARVNYTGVNSGPVVVKSSGNVAIIAAERDAWRWNGVWYSFVQTMGLPAGQLSDTYVFPAYNNISLDEQLRFGVP